MKKAILATKVGMTQIFNADGVLVPVTVLQAGPCVVTQIKTVDNDGYSAVQVGFVDKKEKTVLFVSTGKDMGDATGQYAETNRLLAQLKEEGKIVRVGSDRKGYWEIKDL